MKTTIELIRNTLEKVQLNSKPYCKKSSSASTIDSTEPFQPLTFVYYFVFVILKNCHRKVIHFNVTKHPTAQWTAQQIIEAFPWNTVPKYLIRDRDSIYGNYFK